MAVASPEVSSGLSSGVSPGVVSTMPAFVGAAPGPSVAAGATVVTVVTLVGVAAAADVLLSLVAR